MFDGCFVAACMPMLHACVTCSLTAHLVTPSGVYERVDVSHGWDFNNTSLWYGLVALKMRKRYGDVGCPASFGMSSVMMQRSCILMIMLFAAH